MIYWARKIDRIPEKEGGVIILERFRIEKHHLKFEI